MRKISNKERLFQKRKQVRLRKKQKRAANIRRDAIRRRNLFQRKYVEKFAEEIDLIKARDDFRLKLYNRKYNEKPKSVSIEGDFGIEDESRVNYFFKKATEIIDFNNRKLYIDINNCTRVWPSAITMLCSLKQWVELSTRRSRKFNKHQPQISSSDSKEDAVNLYLKHCGFYDYVARASPEVKRREYSDKEIVKIQRETKTSNMELREDEIIKLFKSYSMFNDEERELFECIVLIEVLNNVTEHGISYRDKGWWVLAQHHKTHGFISLCIADNGIGIKNILRTGPQKSDIANKLDLNMETINDHEFIEMALTEQVSGAVHAPRKTAKSLFLIKKYERGARRGNGLKRIKDTCKKLKIPFILISHHGYVCIDENGIIRNKNSMPKRVFAGTLYHFLIPAKKELKYESH